MIIRMNRISVLYLSPESCPDIPGGPGSAHGPYNAANKTTAHLQKAREDHRPGKRKNL